jgi:hypothetical protein
MSRVEPVLWLLSGLLLVLVAALFAAEIFFKDDSQFFQVVSNMATGILGALLGLITGKSTAAAPPVAPPPVPPVAPPVIPPPGPIVPAPNVP